MEPILTVNHLKTTFHTSNGAVQAVRGISFDVGKGEIVGIVGESGSGKSVTSMSILRLLPSTAEIDQESAVVFEGTDLTRLSVNQLRAIRGQKIAMVFQDPMSSLNPLIRVGKQVEEMLKIHHKDLSKAQLREKVLELFRQVRIPEPEKRYNEFPHQFSGGMRQRVMLAMALANKPDLLIADEPTTALDVTIQDQILKQLRALQQESGASIIFITHDLGVVAELCQRVLVMYGGLIMEEAPIDELFEEPKHPYTLEKLTFRFILDSATALTAYESGDVDSIRSIPSADYARLVASNAGVKVVPNYGTVYYNINCAKEPYNNPLVRKALNLAIDRKTIIENVVPIDATPAFSYLAPSYGVNGKDITDGRGDFGLSATANVEATQAGDYEVAAMGWSADYLNPMSFLPLFKTGDSTNTAFYSNPAYDELVNQVMMETDAAAELTLKADEIISNDYACIPLYYKANNYLMKDYITGVYMVSSSNMYFKNAKVVK